MSASITWVHVGDLHVSAKDGWESLRRLTAIVGEINEYVGEAADFVFLPGDNANNGEPAQYQAIMEALAPLRLPLRIIPGDHDFEPGDLAAYEEAFAETSRPECEVIAGHRCIFLDIVSAGAGGPDFRLTMHDRNRLSKELARAEAENQPAAVFMHAYPGDLAADGDAVARILADAGVAFVDTGHTHYNELLNDGRVIYGATRSTGEIEEGGGRPGFAFVSLHDGVASWRFKELGTAWPFVQIVSPADHRLVTRPADPRQVPRPGRVTVRAKLFGRDPEAPVLSVDGGAGVAMTRDAGSWTGRVELSAGLHKLTVSCGGDRDTIRVLVRGADDIPRRAPPVALGRDAHAVGPWPEHGIDGAQLGPNKNGRHW